MDRRKADASSLIEDLFALEKDFKYNLTLLRIREEEIERCEKANKSLGEQLKIALSKIDGLNVKIVNLEHALRKSEQDRSTDTQIRQQTVNKLTAEIDALKRKERISVEKYEKERRKSEERHAEILNEKKVESNKSLSTFRQRLEQELDCSSRLRQEVHELINENMFLRNQIRSLECKYTSESSSYVDELKSIQRERGDLISETELHKNNSLKLESQLIASERKTAELSRQLLEKDEKIANLINNSGVLQMEIEKLQLLLQDSLNRYEALVKEFKMSKSMIAAKFERVVHQNRMLQEIVKALRQERQKCASKDSLEAQNAEKRLDKLEELLLTLKQSLQSNINLA